MSQNTTPTYVVIWCPGAPEHFHSTSRAPQSITKGKQCAGTDGDQTQVFPSKPIPKPPKGGRGCSDQRERRPRTPRRQTFKQSSFGPPGGVA